MNKDILFNWCEWREITLCSSHYYNFLLFNLTLSNPLAVPDFASWWMKQMALELECFCCCYSSARHFPHTRQPVSQSVISWCWGRMTLRQMGLISWCGFRFQVAFAKFGGRVSIVQIGIICYQSWTLRCLSAPVIAVIIAAPVISFRLLKNNI